MTAWGRDRLRGSVLMMFAGGRLKGSGRPDRVVLPEEGGAPRGFRIQETWGLTPEALWEQERQAVRVIGQGSSVPEGGRILGRYPKTVRGYMQAGNQEGPEALALGPARSSPRSKPRRS